MCQKRLPLFKINVILIYIKFKSVGQYFMAEFFINFTHYIDEDAPVKIRMIGETQQEDNVNVERKDSNIMALEYIISGEGILEIDGKTYYPKVGDVSLFQLLRRQLFQGHTLLSQKFQKQL